MGLIFDALDINEVHINHQDRNVQQVEAESNSMQLLSKSRPLKPDHFDEVLALKDINKVILDTQVKERHVLVDIGNISIFVLLDVFAERGQHIDLILHLVDFAAIFWRRIVFIWHLEVLFVEYIRVAISQIKDRFIVRSNVVSVIGMRRWPLIIVKSVAEYLATE